LFATGGVLSAATDPNATAFTDEELEAAVDEAHRHGKKVCAHAIGTNGITASINAGVDSIEHGFLIDDEGISLMKQRGTFLVPTIEIADYVVEEGAQHGLPADRVAKARALIAERDRHLRAAFAAGVKIAFGTDSGPMPHGRGVREFAKLVNLGLTPLQVVRAATSSAAELLGLEKEIGAIETGKRADIVAVADNPLDDIRALEQVKFVMKDGRVVRNDFQ
jgi:imidazolonepropionase-like amidohydrolase